MLEFLALPGFEHNRLGFLEPALRLGMIDAEALVVVDVVGGASA
jgi:hypothetical protein